MRINYKYGEDEITVDGIKYGKAHWIDDMGWWCGASSGMRAIICALEGLHGKGWFESTMRDYADRACREDITVLSFLHSVKYYDTIRNHVRQVEDQYLTSEKGKKAIDRLNWLTSPTDPLLPYPKE